MNSQWLENLTLWLGSLFGGLAICGARLGWLMFGAAPTPPEDPKALSAWKRKRLWLVFSELSALPAFATLSVVLGRFQRWPIEGIILFSMILGALGFAFFLDALQTIVKQRLAAHHER